MDDVALLSRAVFDCMRARFDTAFGLGAEFKIETGDLMGGVLSPDHARMLLTPLSQRLSLLLCCIIRGEGVGVALTLRDGLHKS